MYTLCGDVQSTRHDEQFYGWLLERPPLMAAWWGSIGRIRAGDGGKMMESDL